LWAYYFIRGTAVDLNTWWQGKLASTDTIINTAGITAVNWQYGLTEPFVEGYEEISQAIAIILKTRYWSDPHRPTFASDIFSLVDTPINRVSPNLIRESVTAITRWEPRCQVNSVSVDRYSEGIESIKITIEWSLTDTTFTGTTEVVL
jgi:phage baseplate assembly protein W